MQHSKTFAVALILAALMAGAAGSWAQTRINTLNGVDYLFPSATGEVGQFLGISAVNGRTTLAWQAPVTPEGLPSGALIALASGSCPSGWTR